MGQMPPLQAFISAFPVPNTTNAAGATEPKFDCQLTRFRKNHLLSPFAVDRTTGRSGLTDVPFISPKVLALPERSGDYLFADGFPNLRVEAAAAGVAPVIARGPAGLLSLGEATSERLKNLPQLAQLVMLLTRKRGIASWLPSRPVVEPDCFDPGYLYNPGYAGRAIGDCHSTGRRPAGLRQSEFIALTDLAGSAQFPCGCDLSLQNCPRGNFMAA